jgi:hypothetical protein
LFIYFAILRHNVSLDFHDVWLDCLDLAGAKSTVFPDGCRGEKSLSEASALTVSA